jgi:hypothetical protein
MDPLFSNSAPTPAPDPNAQMNQFPVPSPIQRGSGSRSGLRVLGILGFAFCFTLFYGLHSGALKAAWDAITGYQLPVSGEPIAATHGKLSEHEMEWLEKQPPQVQMEELMSAAINHDQGATGMIEKKVEGWHGQLKNTKKWETLEMTALYSNDLRVRAAAIEVTLSIWNLPQTPEEITDLWRAGENDVKSRPGNAWVMGMMANRGIETDRVRELLQSWAHDPDEQSRFWAVEGLAHIGTDATINDFLDVLHHDPSLNVRERAGCSLAKSGMLTREQRMKAVPGLMDMADDKELDTTTRGWVYQALREITDVNLPNDPAAWRNWYLEHGAEQAEKFRKDGQSVLGNS